MKIERPTVGPGSRAILGGACRTRAALWGRLLAVAFFVTVPAQKQSRGADPAPPVAPTTTPAAPAEQGLIPGFSEGLPFGPGGPADAPRMELIPPDMKPLEPLFPFAPNGNFGPSPIVQQSETPVDPKTLRFKISKFTLKYGPLDRKPNPALPPIQSLADEPILLGESSDDPASPEPAAAVPAESEKKPAGNPPRKPAEKPKPKATVFVAPGAGARDVPIVLSQIKTTEVFSGDSLQAISGALVSNLNKLNQLGIRGILIIVDPDQIDPSTKQDLRKGSTELTLLIYASEVKQVRTIVKPVAKPPFKAPSTDQDDPKYNKITAHSPLKPASKTTPGSLLQEKALQEYLDRINRFPGRRVDAAVTASGENAGVVLDYITRVERPPVFVYDQTSNTGTEASGTWRTRAGFELRQLAGMDDLLDFGAETSLSSATYSFFGSYQITPIFPDYLKIKAYGGYGRFFAEDVGFDKAEFIGKSGTGGLLAIFTPYYFKGFPIDLIAGIEYKHVDIANIGAFPSEGATSFLLPVLGISTDRTTETYSAFGSLQIEPNISAVTDVRALQSMGRFDVDRDFVIGKYNLGGSFYLEPLLFRKKWAAYQQEADDAKRKGYWHTVTEAHEIALLLHGQYVFEEKRVVPQFEDVIGGFSSVRGYPEAYTAGDNSVIFNAEYRFHLPRVLKPADTDLKRDEPLPATRFSVRPSTILGRPDFDFIFRTFYDVGYVENNQLATATEINRTLMSAGFGAEVQIMRYLNLRADVGFALLSVADNKTSRPTDVGSARVTFVGVVTY